MALDGIVDRPRRSLKRLKPSFIALADRARATGQWERAAQLYRKALQRNPRNAPIWVQYGHALKEAGKLCEPDKLAQAELAYRKALSLDPSVADTYVQLGHVLKLQDKTNEAEASYLRAFALDPSIPYPLRELSGLGWSEAQMAGLRGLVESSLPSSTTPTAEAALSDDVRAEPKGPRRGLIRRNSGAVALADRARNAGEWGRAAQLYRKALDRNPRNPNIWVQYGHALKESGALRDPEKLAQAESAYRQALSLDPLGADTYVQLGHVLKLQDKTNEAEASYLRAFALDPSTPYPIVELSGLGWSAAQIDELKKLFALEGSTAPRSDPSDHSVEVIRRAPDAFETALGEALRRADKVLAALPQTQRREAAPGPIVGDISEGRLLPAARRSVDVPDLFALRVLKPHGRIAVVLHLFDADLWHEMREAIERICHPFDLFVSLTKGASDHMRNVIKESFPDALIFDFEDHGRDIGPFIVFLQTGVLFRYELVCKLHTKRSPHL
ncbi:MAG: tetratricopeptide repeat protein, partial [Alphaproteobacteria bacterium]